MKYAKFPRKQNFYSRTVKYILTCIHTYIHTYTYTSTYTYTFTCAFTYTFTGTYTDRHTHTKIQNVCAIIQVEPARGGWRKFPAGRNATLYDQKTRFAYKYHDTTL